MPIFKYGYQFPDKTTELTIELYCFKRDRSIEAGGLGKFGHLRRAVDLLWNNPSKPTSRGFIWSPWSEELLEEACLNKYLAVAGCASSGKSDAAAVWGIINYLASPTDTLVVMTSTTLREARRRIWKSVVELWEAVPGLPGKLVDSLGCIKGVSKNNKLTDSTGLALLPCEKKQERKAIGKLIGMKQTNVLLIADELPELPESLVDAAYTNMSTNPNFSMMGLGNPNSHFDAFGIMAEPKGGWDTVSENDYSWETDRGKCIRFDATKNPNLGRSDNLYFWMPTQENIDAAKTKYGEKSLLYYRMYKGFWCPAGVDEAIYSAADFIKGRAFNILPFRESIMVASLDPAFTAGGDMCVMTVGELAVEGGMKVLQFLEQIGLQEDITSKLPRSFQIARQFRDACVRKGIAPYSTACDSTGGGGPFLDVLHQEWSSEVLACGFSGKASDRPISADDNTPANERYVNRMSEIWFNGVELLHQGQLKGVSKLMAREMSSRKYDTVGSSAKIVVERKVDYKMRTGSSPDHADSAFILIDLCRTRFQLIGGGRFEQSAGRKQKWQENLAKYNMIPVEAYLLDDK